MACSGRDRGWVTDEKPCPPHHWLIEPPRGEKSWGKCKRCGERREFVNTPYLTYKEQMIIPRHVTYYMEHDDERE